jgi:hypothetical protein
METNVRFCMFLESESFDIWNVEIKCQLDATDV